MMHSYWEKTAFLQTRDLVVVGAGLTGLQAALHYKKLRPAAKVLVLERALLPGGASTKNAGFACFGSPSELLSDFEKQGETDSLQLVEKRYRGLQELRKLFGDSAIDFERCGGFEIFETTAKFERAAEKVSYLNQRLATITGRSETYRILEINQRPAICNLEEGYLHSGKLLSALLERAHQVGIEVWNSCAVSALGEQSLCLDGKIWLESRAVLLATNAFSKELLPDVDINPARGYIFVTAPTKHHWKGSFHYEEGFVYFRDLGNRLLLGGGRNQDLPGENTSVAAINPKIKKYLLDFAHAQLGLPSSWCIEQEWTGIMGFGPSKTPQVQQVAPHLYLAAGMGGMGVALSGNAGRSAAQLIDKQEN